MVSFYEDQLPGNLSHSEEVQLESEVAAEVVDPELLEAQSTIERLAKKYLVKFIITATLLSSLLTTLPAAIIACL